MTALIDNYNAMVFNNEDSSFTLNQTKAHSHNISYIYQDVEEVLKKVMHSALGCLGDISEILKTEIIPKQN